MPAAASSIMSGASSFQHTHIGAYAVGMFAAVCTFGDSVHGFLQRYHINRKWYYLYGKSATSRAATALPTLASDASTPLSRLYFQHTAAIRRLTKALVPSEYHIALQNATLSSSTCCLPLASTPSFLTSQFNCSRRHPLLLRVPIHAAVDQSQPWLSTEVSNRVVHAPPARLLPCTRSSVPLTCVSAASLSALPSLQTLQQLGACHLVPGACSRWCTSALPPGC